MSNLPLFPKQILERYTLLEPQGNVLVRGEVEGQIESQQQLNNDVLTAWDYIEPSYKDKPIVIYGRSLGSALAVPLAQSVESDLVVLVSPFTNMLDVVKSRYPYTPSWLLRYPFATDKTIGSINTDIVFMHGEEDDFIPIEHSVKLQALTLNPSEIFAIEDADHRDIHQFRQYVDALKKVLSE